MKNLTQYKGKRKLVVNDKSNYMHETAFMHLTMKNAKSLHTFVVKPNNSRPGLCFYV